MDRPSREVLARMPLAEAVLLLWRWVTSEERLQQLWSQHRGRCYEKVITFELMVHLMADALLKYDGSGRRAFESGIEHDELRTSLQAAFRKFGRLPVALSQAFLTECTAALREAFPEWSAWQLPASLQEFGVILFDGKAIKRVTKRLKPLRGTSGGLLGGRALVALEWNSGLAVGLHAHEDGDANDVRFVGELVPVVRQHVAGPRLWIGDRAFCDLTQPRYFTSCEGDHFLVRYHPKTPFFPDTQRKQRVGTDEHQRRVVETWGHLGSVHNRHRRCVRKILVERTDEKPLILITDLLDADTYPASDLLWLYAQRWGIEAVFQQVTDVFGLKRLIGGTPKACLFQFSFCLLLYNMLQVIRGYLAETHDIEPDDLSTHKVFEDVEHQLVAWNVLFEPAATQEYFQHPPGLTDLQSRLRCLLGSAWRDRWLKTPAYERPCRAPRKRLRTHNSVYRILQAQPPQRHDPASKPP